MQTALVARLALAALAVSPVLAPGARAQDAMEAFSAAPRLRVADDADRPMLGVMVSDTEDGVLISDILEGSLADRAGLQSGDLLLKLGGVSLDTYEEIGDVLAELGPGSTVTMTVVRKGEGLVKLEGSLPEPEPEEIEEVEEDLLADGHRGGFLGVELTNGDGSGVYVAGVIDNSAAWFAGLETGDLLTRLDDTTLTTNQDLVGAVSSKAPGSMISIGYSRDGMDNEANVRLGHRMPLGPGMLGGGQLPGLFGEGDQWFVPGADGDVRLFAPGLRGRQGQRGGGLQIWQGGERKDLDEFLEGRRGLFGPHGDGEHEVKVTIEDGVLTIERDGEVETHEIDDISGVHDMQIEHLFGDAGHGQLAIFGADGALELLHEDMAECEDALAECAEELAECAAEAAECATDAEACEDMEAECEAACEDETECEDEQDEDDDAVL